MTPPTPPTSPADTFNLADLWEAVVDVVPDRDALVHGDQRWTYAELEDRANRAASLFGAAGVGPGDHVGLHLFNGPAYVEAMIGLVKLRAVPININFRFVAKEIAYMIDNADLVGVVSEEDLAAPLDAAIREADAGDLPDARDLAVWRVPGQWEAALSGPSASPAREFGPRSGDDLYIVYTGGTTGFPKGVMWRQEDIFFAGLQGGAPGGDPVKSHAELAENAKDAELALGIVPLAPYIHGSTQFASWISFFTGGKVVLVDDRSLNPARTWELAARERVHTVSIVGDAMARPLLDELQARGPASWDLENLMVLASAGSTLSPSLRDRLQELLPETMVMNNFGSTETGHQGSAYPDEDPGPDNRPTFYMDDDNLVLDDDLRPVAPGSGVTGRLARRGRVPLGYYKDPVKTAERFKTIDGVRHVLPGDFATVLEDGRITVFGRGSVCINTGGEKVFPEEVEEALKAHPAVYDAVVVGIPDDTWMERVAAVVLPRPPSFTASAAPMEVLTLEALATHCRQHIAGYKVPRKLILVTELQRTAAGKPDYAWAKRVAAD